MMVYRISTLEDLLGKHAIYPGKTKDYQLAIGDNKIVITGSGKSFFYKRYTGNELEVEATIMAAEDAVVIGIFPNPPLLTPKPVASNLYLKLRPPVIVSQRSQAVVYAKMPIEIGIYRQEKDEEVLLDAFSLKRQQYALYGSPEAGVVCRYIETPVGADKDEINATKYEEAVVRIKIRNEIDNIVKVSKVVVPMEGVILDHAHDDAWLSGSVEMVLDSTFGQDIVNVRLVHTKVKRSNKTSLAKRQETLTFVMDAGY